MEFEGNGLSYVPEFITVEEEKELEQFLMSQPWRNEKKRRMQTYGYRYLKGEYNTTLHKVEIIEGPILKLLNKITDHFGIPLNQCTVNEYEPGNGIDAHFDHKERFGKDIVGVSLGSGCTMIFESEHLKSSIPIYLSPRSMYKMSGKIRYDYTHRIKGVVSDMVDDNIIPRTKRISLTFRYCQ
jgi:alkylated DNA repair dioxygenase AlkB